VIFSKRVSSFFFGFGGTLTGGSGTSLGGNNSSCPGGISFIFFFIFSTSFTISPNRSNCRPGGGFSGFFLRLGLPGLEDCGHSTRIFNQFLESFWLY